MYGKGAADLAVGRALAGVPREDYCLVGAIGHDFYEGERQGAKGFPRLTDPALRGPEAYGDYIRMATERSLERCGVDRFDVLLLHNPDRIGFTSEAVWAGMAAVRDEGLTGAVGVAPGPANGYVLDVIGCMERFADVIDWGMVILNAFEPWPVEMVLPAAEQHGVQLITRVADFGGIFHDDVKPGHTFADYDHRSFRPQGWVEQGAAKLEQVRPIAERHGLTMLQFACQWVLAQPAVVMRGADADPGDRRRRAADRGEARRARRDAEGDPADARGPRRGPAHRGQHRLHAAQGRRAGPRGRGAARPLADDPGSRGDRGPLGHRSRGPAPDAHGVST